MKRERDHAPGIAAAARPAWLLLAHRLDDLADQGVQPPCVRQPDDWSADADDAVKARAAAACISCPVLELCTRYADAACESWHTWAGRDRAQHQTNAERAA